MRVPIAVELDPRGSVCALAVLLAASVACQKSTSGRNAASDATPIPGWDSAPRDARILDGGESEDAEADQNSRHDASSAPDAGPTPEAGADASAPPDNGPIRNGAVSLLEETDHGLPGCYRCAIGVADFDGDGRPDVVMAGAFDSVFTPGMGSYRFNNVVRLYRNVSLPGQRIQFELQQELTGVRGGGGAIVKVGDFDGDRVPDFAVQFRDGPSPDADTSSFMNEGGWRFRQRVLAPRFNSQSTSLGMDAADIDRDGLDDLIFISDGHGRGPGLWYKWVPERSEWQPRQTDFVHQIAYGGTIAAGDLDGDGYPDIVVGGNSRAPFGEYDCTSTVLYGQIHLNRGARNPGINPQARAPLGRFALRSNRNDPWPCTGMDNASMLITDVDNDGHNDIIIAGSADAFRGPPGLNASHYDFAVLRNVDGTGNNFVTFENAGVQYPSGTTNGGAGNVDSPNIAVGDLTGDGLPEVLIQGHHRDYAGDVGAYVFETRLFLNDHGTGFTELHLGFANVGEGGQAMADFNHDGKIDLMFTGARIPFHTNGSNPIDENSTATLKMHVYRNTRP